MVDERGGSVDVMGIEGVPRRSSEGSMSEGCEIEMVDGSTLSGVEGMGESVVGGGMVVGPDGDGDVDVDSSSTAVMASAACSICAVEAVSVEVVGADVVVSSTAG